MIMKAGVAKLWNMEQHEKTPHKDLEIFVQRERIVKPGGNLPLPKRNLKI